MFLLQTPALSTEQRILRYLAARIAACPLPSPCHPSHLPTHRLGTRAKESAQISLVLPTPFTILRAKQMPALRRYQTLPSRTQFLAELLGAPLPAQTQVLAPRRAQQLTRWGKPLLPLALPPPLPNPHHCEASQNLTRHPRKMLSSASQTCPKLLRAKRACCCPLLLSDMTWGGAGVAEEAQPHLRLSSASPTSLTATTVFRCLFFF